jgi:hypothetical protein
MESVLGDESDIWIQNSEVLIQVFSWIEGSK